MECAACGRQLIVASVLAAWMSEILVGAAEGTGKALGMSQTFIGIVFLAIVGGAAESGSAIAMARKNKIDLSVGIALGSSIQIALFVAPVLCWQATSLRRSRWICRSIAPKSGPVPGRAAGRDRLRGRPVELVQGDPAYYRLLHDRADVLRHPRLGTLDRSSASRGLTCWRTSRLDKQFAGRDEVLVCRRVS